MAIPKQERLVSLVMCLLAARRYVTKEELRSSIESYRMCTSDEAFDRMFERDKDDVRELGFTIETGANDPLVESADGYRIRPEHNTLPPVDLDPEEAAALALAAGAWQQSSLSGAATGALYKLKAAGVEIDTAPLTSVEPRVTARESAFGPLLEALRARRPVQFTYRGSGAAEASQRVVEPWGMSCWRGRWYLVGWARDREEQRVFRLERVLDKPKPKILREELRAPVPENVDIRAQVARFAGEGGEGSARIRLRAGAGFPLRARATAVKQVDEAWDELELPYGHGLHSWLAEFGADVVVLDPPDLRGAVVRQLRAAAGLPVGAGAAGVGAGHEASEGISA
ncbi:helix-turn-helix transcriptional regulator [Yinghuangia soli]|uniref:WYL domain-containing protein n=1 Tax=Yinghuangia soli TaxID=2908204 RepID=A0AA41U1D6_9ACTN|nr:WYL domain-containing protein [Yinghuangia soli]MCF2527432.1 WYL domain-containing protein [Yinghuangia soli]